MSKHAQNKDTILDQNGLNEISASDLKSFVDSKGQIDGLAELNGTGTVPLTQLPSMDYIPTGEKGAPDGVAELNALGIVPSTQLPTPPTVPVTSVNTQIGDVMLDAADVGAIPTGAKGAQYGVAELDINIKVPKTQLPTLAASDVQNDSWVTGATVKDALNVLNSGLPIPLVNLYPVQGFLFPLATTRAYYEKILYSPTAIFNNGATTYRYVAYYGNGTNNFACYSQNGINWTGEAQVTGVMNGYHCEAMMVGTTIHLFYWNPSLIYTPAAIRHATINSAVNCNIATADAPLSGNYVTGVFADGLRYGTYGADKVFYNATPTNDPNNPYSYAWCMLHSGTTGNDEGVLFATSSDGYNFSSWHGNQEVIPRGTKVPLQWDAWLGNVYVWKEGSAWYMYYAGGIGTINGSDSNFADGLGFATSTDGITWTKYGGNPVIFKTYSYKTAKRLYCPCIIKQDDGWILYYTAKSQAGDYRVSTAIVHRLIT